MSKPDEGLNEEKMKAEVMQPQNISETFTFTVNDLKCAQCSTKPVCPLEQTCKALPSLLAG